MAINFISSKDSDETRTLLAKSNNAEILMGSETNEIIKELFKYFLQIYQEGLEESMRGSEFIFDNYDSLYYDLNKISLSRGGSYIDSAEWLKNKKAIINPKTHDGKCFQYPLTLALNYEHIKKYEFRNKDINKFILLLRKGVYPYEYVDIWERFAETSLPDKEAFYIGLKMEDIIDVDYRQAKRVFNNNKL